MATQDLCEVTFEWPHPEPTNVIVTGTFDQWSCSVPLTKTPTGFVGTTKIPWGEKIKFKYVVDNRWLLHENQATETDPGGFVNHVYIAPPAPPAEEAPSTTLNPEQASNADVIDNAEPAEDKEPVVNSHVENGDVAIPNPAEKRAEEAVESSTVDAAEEVENNSDSEPAASAIHPAGYPQFLSDIADTIAARDGTSSTLGYVASGLGAVIHSVVGVDPINNHQIAIPTPKTDDAFSVPGGSESAPNSATLPVESTSTPAVIPEIPKPLPSPVAPRVPILIVPVNAAENNTAAASESEPITSPPVTVTEVMTPPEATPEATVAPGEKATVAKELIPESTIPQAEAEAEPASAVSDTPIEQTTSKEEVIVPAPVVVEDVASPDPDPAPGPTVSTEPAVEEQPVAVVAEEEPPKREVEIAVAVEESIADAKTYEAPTAEPEPVTAPTIKKALAETPAPESAPTPAADDLVAEVRAEALAQIPTEPIEVKAEELVPEAVVPTTEPVHEEPAAPKVEEPVAVQPEPVSVAEVVKGEEPIPSKPAVEQMSVSEPTLTTTEPASEEIPATKTEVEVQASKEEEPVISEPVVANVPAKEEDTAAPALNGGSIAASKVEEPSVIDVAAAMASKEPSSEVPAIEELVAKVKADGALQENLIITGAATEEPAIDIKKETMEVPETAITEPVSETVSEPISTVIVPESVVTVVEDKAPEESSSVPEVSQIVTETSNPKPVEKTEVVSAPKPVDEVPIEIAAAKSVPVSEIPTAEPAPAIKPVSVVEPTPVVEPVPITEPSATQPIPITAEPSTDSTAGQPSSNGHKTAVAVEPSTPTKEKKTFPSTSESAAASADNSPSSSKFSTMRKKRTSILGKLKHIFHPDKEKDKEKK